MATYIQRYCQRSGIQAISHLNFYLSFVQFRYAVMIQGILKRASVGTTVNRQVLYTQDRVAEIAALARSTLSHAA